MRNVDESSSARRRHGVRVWVVTAAADMVRLRGAWDDLASSQTIFQSFLWSQAAAWAFAGRERPHVVIAESDSGMAIIPAVVRGGGELALLGETLFDYRAVMSRGDPHVVDAAWTELATLSKPLEVTAIRGNESVDSWRGMRLLPFASAPGIGRDDLDAEALGASHRKLGRFTRRISRKGIVLRRHAGANRTLVSAIYREKAAQSNGTPNLFVDPVRREFMESICALEAGCEIFTYETETALVAALVTFRHGPTRHFYTIYHDRKYASDSPGQVLLFEVAALTLQEGLDCDFMTGSSPYKDRLATRQVPLYRVECSAQELRRLATVPEAA